MKAFSPWSRARPALGLVGWLIALLSARAELSWTTQAQTLAADPARSEIAASFNFRNGGPRPVTITAINTSCGCTAATLAKSTYAPGEAGRVDVVLRYAGDTAEVAQTVTVTTDEPGRRPDELKLTVMVPISPRAQRLAISPRFVKWTQGGPGQPQTVRLRVTGTGDPLRPIAVSTSDPVFRAELLEPSREHPDTYEVLITPLRVDAPRQAVIAVTTNSDQFERGSTAIIYRITATIE